MSGAREAILARLTRRPAPAGFVPEGVSPAAGRDTGAGVWTERAAQFRARASAAAATVAEVDTPAAVGEAVSAYLRGAGLAQEVCLSGLPPELLTGTTAALRCRQGLPRADGETVVTGCFAAVAQEGVIVMASGPAHAAESAFLAANHVVVVEPAQLIDSLETLWARLRAGERPRMLNLVLGPSRTADLGVPSRLGAHGPLRVHVILVRPAGAG